MEDFSKSSGPLVSVIVPVYNVEKYLSRCVDSILAQTYKNFELILVDDGSPDACPAICDEYQKVDGRIKVIHKKNGGVSSARNAGLKAASGEYICFVDSDDYVDARYVEKLLKAAIETGADMVVCGYCYEKLGKKLEISFSEKLLSKRDFILDFFNSFTSNEYMDSFRIMSVWNKLYRRSVIGKTKFCEEYKNGEDFVFNIEIANNCKSIFYLDKILYHYIRNESGASSVAQKSGYNWERRFRESEGAIKRLKNLLNENGLPEEMIANYVQSTLLDNLVENATHNALFKKRGHGVCKAFRKHWKTKWLFTPPPPIHTASLWRKKVCPPRALFCKALRRNRFSRMGQFKDKGRKNK